MKSSKSYLSDALLSISEAMRVENTKDPVNTTLHQQLTEVSKQLRNIIRTC